MEELLAPFIVLGLMLILGSIIAFLVLGKQGRKEWGEEKKEWKAYTKTNEYLELEARYARIERERYINGKDFIEMERILSENSHRGA